MLYALSRCWDNAIARRPSSSAHVIDGPDDRRRRVKLAVTKQNFKNKTLIRLPPFSRARTHTQSEVSHTLTLKRHNCSKEEIIRQKLGPIGPTGPEKGPGWTLVISESCRVSHVSSCGSKIKKKCTHVNSIVVCRLSPLISRPRILGLAAGCV